MLENINSLFFALTCQEQTKLWLQEWNDDFDEINWEDRATAWKLINQGQELVKQNANFDQLRPVMLDLLELLPENEKEKVEKSLLLG